MAFPKTSTKMGDRIQRAPYLQQGFNVDTWNVFGISRQLIAAADTAALVHSPTCLET